MNECYPFHVFWICSVLNKLPIQVYKPSQLNKYSVLTSQLHYLLFIQKSPSETSQKLPLTEELITAVLLSRNTSKLISRKDKIHRIIWPKVAYHCLQHLQKQLHHLTTTNHRHNSLDHHHMSTPTSYITTHHIIIH